MIDHDVAAVDLLFRELLDETLGFVDTQKLGNADADKRRVGLQERTDRKEEREKKKKYTTPQKEKKRA